MAIDYPADGTDADGNDFIADNESRYIILYTPTNDDWGTTRSSGDGFYGADKSGTLYYDGNACGFGDFGTLAAGLRHTAWGASRDTPLDERYVSSAFDISLSADDTLYIQGVTSVTDETAYVSSALRWYVQGDFDVEVEWLDFSMTGGTTGGAYFACCVDDDHWAYLRRRTPGGDKIDSGVRLNGSNGDYTTVSTVVTTGKFRFTRTGSTLRRYYDIGGGWVQTGTDQTLGTDDVYFWVGLGVAGTATTLEVKFRDVTINSGTTTNKIGWTREVFGSHRGNRDDFPDNAIIVSTASSVDIIDVDNDLLWLRFVAGSYNVLDTVGVSNVRPRRVYMRHGVLLIGWGNTTNAGMLIRVDFNLDCIEIHRGEASSVTGAHYKSPHGSDLPGILLSQGALRGRNSGEGWGTDNNSWKQQDYSTRAGALWIDSGYEYRASANKGGIAVFKWRRWYLSNPTAPEGIEDINWAQSGSTSMYWCHFRTVGVAGELMYMDTTNVYSALKATYEAAFDGSFSADYTKALPGTRTNDVQYALVPYSTNRFYTPANEGVYQVDWPSGSFVHQYGASSSGAVHEILPANTTVQSLIVTEDGGVPVLVLALYFTVLDVNQLMAINLSTDAVYAYSLQTSSNEQYAEGAV